LIGLILGTSEGRDILSSLNKVTCDIFISTATKYGGDILKDYKFACLNTMPLDYNGLIQVIKDKGIDVLVDASHPYAVEITKNAEKACKDLNIEYIRYERPSCIEEFKDDKRIITVEDYRDLYEKIKFIDGTILNTTGSKNLDFIMSMNLKNRIVHRVLPRPEVIEKCYRLGVGMDDIIAIKGPISYEMNCLFIREYEPKAVILKDSGIRGGTYDKVKACLDCGIYAFVINRKKIKYDNVFYDIEKMVNYLEKKYIFRG
jgi:precorrin-6A/cobalt-precorrin-6A reductase